MKKLTRREHERARQFTERYGERGGAAGLAIEREVIGENVGLNGYTTPAQVDRLARELRLRRGTALLDLGAGRGWPGVRLAKQTGSAVVLADVPRPALKSALGRARRERIAGRCSVVQMTANALPFAPDSFDAIVHTDVMC